MIRFLKNLLFIAALIWIKPSHCQDLIAKKPNVTIKDLYTRVNSLISDMTEQNKNILRQETEIMAGSNNEEQIHLAANIYSRALGEPLLAEKTKELLFTRFPKGKTARLYVHGIVFENKDLDIPTLEKLYNEWLQNFPPSLYSEKEQDLYVISQMYLAERYAKAGMFDKLLTSLSETKNTNYYFASVINSYKALDSIKQSSLLPQLETAYLEAEKMIIGNDSSNNSNQSSKRTFVEISLLLAKKWVQTGQYDRGLLALNHPALQENKSYEVMLQRVQILGLLYRKTNRAKDALQAYEDFFIAHGQEGQLVQDASQVYNLIPEKTQKFETYLTSLLKQNYSELYENYKKEMIMQPATDFTLLDTQGKKVSLSDYRGKIVVLDFWATWCVPCIRSFPGMQAAVEKYAKDESIVFLFIDTWQREEDFKKVVMKFLEDNQYSFHVLFDEMRDASKSVATAYKLKGIPTKIIIDEQGYIRFYSTGSEHNPEKIIKELDIKIGLAKSQ